MVVQWFHSSRSNKSNGSEAVDLVVSKDEVARSSITMGEDAALLLKDVIECEGVESTSLLPGTGETFEAGYEEV